MNIPIIVLGIFAILLIVGIFIFNQLVRHRNLMKEAFSGIDVQLKRRHDLVPNLVETVKGYSRHEQGVLENVAKLRSQVQSADSVVQKGEKESELSRSIKTIFALAESYPDLKADKSFLSLQANLVEIEDQLQMARRYYNGTVRNYNVVVESFPSNLIAGQFQFHRADFFELEYATDRQTPDVRF